MAGLLGYLRRQGVVRGLLGGRRAWLVLGAMAWTIRLLRRFAGTRQLRTVSTEELRPGEGLLISHLPDRRQ
ncbi:MAG: hypothetical protein OXF64_09495 [bacterium]|nr:hypothetical protein [bacterium]MCY4194045.1 hypothetical protein [bacterium]MCY4273584.1 hypothetical protein [bacterium]